VVVTEGEGKEGKQGGGSNLARDFDADGLAVPELGAEDFALAGVGEKLGTGHCNLEQ